MAKNSSHICTQGDRLISLEKDYTSMSKTLDEIKTNLNINNAKLDEILRRLDTLPIDFTTKKDFDIEKELNTKFKNEINLKIAYMTGIFTTISTVASFLLNKFI